MGINSLVANTRSTSRVPFAFGHTLDLAYVHLCIMQTIPSYKKAEKKRREKKTGVCLRLGERRTCNEGEKSEINVEGERAGKRETGE